MQPINPFDLPSVKLSELNQLPEKTAIYFAIDAQNRILYIGQASNLAARWKNHHRTFQLQEIDKDSAVRIAWKTWNQEGLDEAEKYFIQTFHPSLNGSEVKAPKIIPSGVGWVEVTKPNKTSILVGFYWVLPNLR